MLKKYVGIRGFTLIEMMLVLVIMASIIYMLTGYVVQKGDEIRRDRATVQMQQILNAAMAYYVNNSYWPVLLSGKTLGDCTGSLVNGIPDAALDTLVNAGYLPSSIKNPWNRGFTIGCDSTTGNFSVATAITKTGDAAIVAGRLPFGRVVTVPVINLPAAVTTINIPGQNLNNARSINYSGIYHSGACVPAPKCPGNMRPSIVVVPIDVSGVTDMPSSPTSQATVNPISSFTAFARGNLTTNDPTAPTPGPVDCKTTVTPVVRACNFQDDPLPPIPLTDPANTLYWRVCLRVITSQGIVNPDPQGQTSNVAKVYAQGIKMGTILAMTRCVPMSESPSGSTLQVFTPNEAWKP